MKVIYLDSDGEDIRYEIKEVDFNSFDEYVEYLKESEDIEEYRDGNMGLWIDEESVECVHEEGIWKYELMKD